jgi:hypothetical protein
MFLNKADFISSAVMVYFLLLPIDNHWSSNEVSGILEEQQFDYHDNCQVY